MTLHYFIETGEYDKHIRRMTHRYEEKREMLVKELKRRFKENVHIKDIRAGLHFLAEFKTNRTYEEVNQRARERKIELYPLTRFMLDEERVEEDNIVLIIGFANINYEEIREAVERLYDIIYGI